MGLALWLKCHKVGCNTGISDSKVQAKKGQFALLFFSLSVSCQPRITSGDQSHVITKLAPTLFRLWVCVYPPFPRWFSPPDPAVCRCEQATLSNSGSVTGGTRTRQPLSTQLSCFLHRYGTTGWLMVVQRHLSFHVVSECKRMSKSIHTMRSSSVCMRWKMDGQGSHVLLWFCRRSRRSARSFVRLSSCLWFMRLLHLISYPRRTLHSISCA